MLVPAEMAAVTAAVAGQCLTAAAAVAATVVPLSNYNYTQRIL